MVGLYGPRKVLDALGKMKEMGLRVPSIEIEPVVSNLFETFDLVKDRGYWLPVMQ